MADRNDDLIEPEDNVSEPLQADASTSLDPNDEIPVPIAMEPAEIDERAQVVEALRARNASPSRDDDSRMEA
jgi:hypothetical protein